ncbi:methyltransferase domain-containing protein [Bradyrhizobium sp. OAE829]|uniref:methyltransferase domain-containing protein n=1 Tax=Bradyrhizobium sp. OAE829 TaxID=2663807 RepID=UPI00178A21C9
MSIEDFSFREHALTFDRHIGDSIPGYASLVKRVLRDSRRFIQPRTNVYDIGCSSGRTLAKISRLNRSSRERVTYIGIDCEPSFEMLWRRHRAPNLKCGVGDVRTCKLENASLVISQFTVQFIPPADKRALLRRIHDSLIEGGALMIAEKTLAGTARLQDVVTFSYYDHKLERGFTAEQIIEKERQLRGQMTCMSEAELREALKEAGFNEIERIWGEAPFAAFLALK